MNSLINLVSIASLLKQQMRSYHNAFSNIYFKKSVSENLPVKWHKINNDISRTASRNLNASLLVL